MALCDVAGRGTVDNFVGRYNHNNKAQSVLTIITQVVRSPNRFSVVLPKGAPIRGLYSS